MKLKICCFTKSLNDKNDCIVTASSIVKKNIPKFVSFLEKIS